MAGAGGSAREANAASAVDDGHVSLHRRQIHVTSMSGEELGAYVVAPGEKVSDLQHQVAKNVGIGAQEAWRLTFVDGASALQADARLDEVGDWLHVVMAPGVDARVVVRCRPMLETDGGGTHSFEMSVDPDARKVVLSANMQTFTFDHVFGGESCQRDIFEHAAQDLVEGVMQGQSAAILVFGPSGAGKSHTLFGTPPSAGQDRSIGDGVLPRAFDIIEAVVDDSPRTSYILRVSFLAIESERVYDLLTASRKHAQQTLPVGASYRGGKNSFGRGGHAIGCSRRVIRRADEMRQALAHGLAMNEALGRTQDGCCGCKWRSDLIFTIDVEAFAHYGHERGWRAQLTATKLKGSERRFRAEQHTSEKACRDSSTRTLLEVVSRLADRRDNPQSFAPYRNSKLTYLLQDSLGSSRLLWLACCSPKEESEETRFTLGFAETAAHIVSYPGTQGFHMFHAHGSPQQER